MCVLNRTARPQKFQFDWKKEPVVDEQRKREARFDKITYAIRDLWTKKKLGTTRELLNAEVASHDVLMVRLEKIGDLR
jgi:alpha-galactosidase